MDNIKYEIIDFLVYEIVDFLVLSESFSSAMHILKFLELRSFDIFWD